MFDELKIVAQKVKLGANKTPVMTSRTLNSLIDNEAQVFIKCENFQKTGSFKFRGAWNALSCLSDEEKERGVVAHSSGNHAQAVALAAKLLGIKAVIVMPKNAPQVKKEATGGYGAEIVISGNDPTDREKVADELVREKGYTLVHPHDNKNVFLGAGTAAYELIEEVGPLDLLFVPVGGGGLLSGSSIAAKGLYPTIKVIAVEPKNADDAFRSFYDKKLYPSINPNTIADGLRTSLGKNTFKVILKNVDQIITVSEEQIVDAMQFYWERMKLVVEPSGAVSLAGLMYSDKIRPITKGAKIGVIISGGNIDLTQFFETIKEKLN
ncbi:MAG: pyridoxal-phosphate dependent enzyme [Promethearchaeota archaeon]|nr:MAG: pyridoxal-phosphate dependent enzyme [Candidatus Lokiarchaeota archaeon]